MDTITILWSLDPLCPTIGIRVDAADVVQELAQLLRGSEPSEVISAVQKLPNVPVQHPWLPAGSQLVFEGAPSSLNYIDMNLYWENYN